MGLSFSNKNYSINMIFHILPKLIVEEVKGRCAALEILIATPAVRNLIREGKTYQIASVMQTGKKYGMQTLDDAILAFLDKKMISPDSAYSNCIDKAKFLKYLLNPPSDFTEV